MEQSSKNYYDKLAHNYEEVSSKKSEYIKCINQIIAENAPKNVKDYLDIGCGDGLRTKKIIEMVHPGQTTLVDTSEEMMNLTRSNVANATYKCIDPIAMEDEKKFDLITSLWNVIGHFPDFEYKTKFFEKINMLLTRDGVFIFDVNNRFNIAQYGVMPVIRNFANDIIYGQVSGFFKLQLSEKVNTEVYIHKPGELEKYITNAQLKIHKKFYVNYNSGVIEKSPLQGQLVYIINKDL